MERLKVLEDWLREQGVEHAAVMLRRSSGGGEEEEAGMFASTDLEQGQVLFTIPDRLILRPRAHPSAAPSPDRLSYQGALSAQAVLALRILHELQLGERSTVGPYLRSLPKSDEMHMPLLWSDEEAELLDEEEGGAGEEDMTLSAWRAWVRQEGEEALRLVKEEQQGPYTGLRFSTEDWLWARAIALSRAYLMDPADPWSLALIPLVDMSNHEDNSSCAIRNSSNGSISFTAVKPYPQGHEVLSSYGPLHAALKLFSWGYLEEIHLGDDRGSIRLPKQGYVQLTFDLRTGEIPALEEKKRVLAKHAGFGAERGGGGDGLDEVAFEVLVTITTADANKARVAIDNEKEIKRMKQVLRVLLLDEDKVLHAGWTDEEVWTAGAYAGDQEMEEDVTAVILQECQGLMRDRASRLAVCQERRAAQELSSTGGHRLALTELWLRGQLMALDALAEYLLTEIGE